MKNVRCPASTTSTKNYYPIHFSLLKVAINALGSEQLQHKIDQCAKKIRGLSNNVTAEEYIQKWENVQKLPSTHRKIKVSLEKDPSKYTLEDIIDLQEDFCKEFLSGVSNAMYLHQIKGGSTILALAYPHSLTNEISKIISQDNNRSFFERHGISSMLVNKKKIFDKSKIR